MKSCLKCKHLKYKEDVFDGYIEHKDNNGDVWMLEPKHKTVDQHCPLCQDTYSNYWNKIKDLPSNEIGEVECDCFEQTEESLKLDELIELAKSTLDLIKK